MQKKRIFVTIILAILVILPFVIRKFKVLPTEPFGVEKFITLALPKAAERSYYLKPCFSPDGQTFLIVDGTAIQKTFFSAPFPPRSESDYTQLLELDALLSTQAVAVSNQNPKTKIAFFAVECLTGIPQLPPENVTPEFIDAQPWRQRLYCYTPSTNEIQMLLDTEYLVEKDKNKKQLGHFEKISLVWSQDSETLFFCDGKSTAIQRINLTDAKVDTFYSMEKDTRIVSPLFIRSDGRLSFVRMNGRLFDGITLSASGEVHEKRLLYSLEDEVNKHFKEFNQIITDTGVFATIGERRFAYALLDSNGTHIRIGSLDAPQQTQAHFFRDTDENCYFFTPYAFTDNEDTLVLSRKFLRSRSKNPTPLSDDFSLTELGVIPSK